MNELEFCRVWKRTEGPEPEFMGDARPSTALVVAPISTLHSRVTATILWQSLRWGVPCAWSPLAIHLTIEVVASECHQVSLVHCLLRFDKVCHSPLELPPEVVPVWGFGTLKFALPSCSLARLQLYATLVDFYMYVL